MLHIIHTIRVLPYKTYSSSMRRMSYWYNKAVSVRWWRRCSDKRLASSECAYSSAACGSRSEARVAAVLTPHAHTRAPTMEGQQLCSLGGGGGGYCGFSICAHRAIKCSGVGALKYDKVRTHRRRSHHMIALKDRAGDNSCSDFRE